MYTIKWTNIFSNETGYVEKIVTKEQHFINTYNKNEAKLYKTENAAKKAISTLVNYGEAEYNTFEILSI